MTNFNPIKLINGQLEVELQEVFGSDRRIAEAAWTSSTTLDNKNLKSDIDVERVVKMLADQRHSTPFESVVFRFWIKMPIAIDRQHMTHRIGSHNGMSGRYRTMPTEYLDLDDEIESILNKTLNGDMSFSEYYEACETANSLYKLNIIRFKEAEKTGAITNQEYKRLREFFRGMLPQHNMTERVSIMNLRSFANYQKLRNTNYAQKEIQQVSQLMFDCVHQSKVCPIALSQLKLNGWNI